MDCLRVVKDNLQVDPSFRWRVYQPPHRRWSAFSPSRAWKYNSPPWSWRDEIRYQPQTLKSVEDTVENLRDVSQKLREQVSSFQSYVLNPQRTTNKAENTNARMGLDLAHEKHFKLEMEIKKLNIEMNNLKQRNFSNDLELAGIPQCGNEKPFEKLDKLARIIGAPPVSVTVTDAFWLLKFSSASAREVWRKKRKILQELTWPDDCDCPELLDNCSALPSYRRNQQKCIKVYERLTAFNKELLYCTRCAASMYDFKWVWVSNGNILVKRYDESECIKIRCEGDVVEKIIDPGKKTRRY
ncbi:Hypothetical predicted protein [Cloeon dipterum]|uniref:FP protein C-terminal domain-containing protein n=1 Tax=Cloeon dipterum TaxID=197152 RepID=A0A8S1DZV8_9INSE|nr:Hypothetical predicted protein [Cloeon dipterum]